MDASLRNTPALLARIEKLRNAMMQRFEAIVSLAAVSHSNDKGNQILRTDRNNTAIAQYRMQTETAALISAAEDAQSLIRQLQETWLFGQLNTLGDSKAQQQTNEDANAITMLLKQLAEIQGSHASNSALEQATQVSVASGE